ncbi:MAG: hypothetical protein R3192_12105 [Woeseiaceae bacterium]|nr:hypothetical protein [Woeseiaceae bacterium]
MLKIIGLVVICLALPGCVTTPGSTAGAGDAVEQSGVQVAATDSGLGTVAYDERTRKQTCKKERMPGSHISRSVCEDRSDGSYSVKDRNWATLGQYQVGEITEPR